MVFDTLENAPQYYGLGARFRTALEWLASADASRMEPGRRITIDGDSIYATYFDVDTLPQADSKLEGHLQYADIQCLVAGAERMGYALRGTVPSLGAYEPDIAFFGGDWATLPLRPKNFYIVWPQDLHAPRVADGTVSRVKRLVVKVLL